MLSLFAQIGFSYARLDQDGRQRRALLGVQTPDGFKFSLALLLAESYLAKENIELENGLHDPSTMRFGTTEIPRVTSNFGGYVNINAGQGDIQTLINFRKGANAFRFISLKDVLAGNFEKRWIQDRIALVGLTTFSFQDYATVPSTSVIRSNNDSPQKTNQVYGIEIHAHVVSQILDAVLAQRTQIQAWPDLLEYAWILLWSTIGFGVALLLRNPLLTFLGIALSLLSLGAIAYALFILGWWIPIVPSTLSLMLVSLGLSVLYQFDRYIHTKLEAQKQAITILEEAKKELEIQVEARTAELQQFNTELLQAKDVAEAASEAKGKFLAHMSHELRTPLNAILGFSQMMSQDWSLSKSHQHRIQMINHSGEHLLGLINDILAFAKLESGRYTIQKSIFSIEDLVDTINALFRIRIEQKGIQFQVETTSKLSAQLLGDIQKLRQILINLLSNALKFTSHGFIAVRITEMQKDHQILLRFAVEDTGAGIAQEELHKLFIPFEQTTSGKRVQTGTGLGLAISQQLTKLMGGDLTVTSEIGQGSIFTFTAYVDIVPDAIASQLLDQSKNNSREEMIRQSIPNQVDDIDIPKETVLSALQSMPREWQTSLHHAASQLNGHRIVELLKDLSLEHKTVTLYLQYLAENYEYTQITSLIKRLQDP